MKRKILVGNWKMNKVLTDVLDFIKELEWRKSELPATNSSPEIFIAPPFPYLYVLQKELSKFDFKIGAQNCSGSENGAFTGEVSASMLNSIGCQFVILGHSERRKYFYESNLDISKKVQVALSNQLTPIICIGESLEERRQGDFFSILEEQLLVAIDNCPIPTNLIIAYEPVWAIGTGQTATPEQAQEVHSFIRSLLRGKYGESASTMPILYGGSCNPKNANDLFSCSDIDGGLIGGASLSVTEFLSLAKSF